ncbi:unnamed protein product, partial [Trichogramma brassicae]
MLLFGRDPLVTEDVVPDRTWCRERFLGLDIEGIMTILGQLSIFKSNMRTVRSLILRLV